MGATMTSTSGLISAALRSCTSLLTLSLVPFDFQLPPTKNLPVDPILTTSLEGAGREHAERREGAKGSAAGLDGEQTLALEICASLGPAPQLLKHCI